MFPYFLNNVFLLNLSLETAQSIFNGFTILNPNFSHSIHPHSGCDRLPIITYSKNYGELPVMFQPVRKAVLPGPGRAYLCRLLRDQTRGRNRLPVLVRLSESK